MIVNISNTWTKILEYYFNNDNYSIYNDPSITYQEVVFIENVRFHNHYDSINAGLVEPTKEINTDDFEHSYDYWYKCFIAQFFQDTIIDDSWNSVLQKRCDKNNIDSNDTILLESLFYKDILSKRKN